MINSGLAGFLAGLFAALPFHPALAAAPAPGSVIKDCIDCPSFVVIPAGKFLMGGSSGEESGAGLKSGAIEQGSPEILEPTSDSLPRHLVTIAQPFAIGISTITYAQFAAFVHATGYQQDGNDCLLTDVGPNSNSEQQDIYTTNQAVRNMNWQFPPWPVSAPEPVTCVNWSDAEAYAAWLSAKTGHHYRLPSEAEWEYAARAGTSGYWFWGNNPNQACQYGNVADLTFLKQRWRSPTPDNHFSCDDHYAWNAPIASFKPNAWGVYDVVGNVAQMVADCWHGDYRGAPTDGSAWLAGGDCRFKVLRGDNGMLGLAASHLAARKGAPVQQYRSTLGGFRLVRDL